jgi:hypothetical protein
MKAKRILPAAFLAMVVTAAVLLETSKSTATLCYSGASDANSLNTPSHVESHFEFNIRAPYEKGFSLFGALKERCWGGDGWNPQFVYPVPARDTLGEVFILTHGHGSSTWVNTAFDPSTGHIQYVYFTPDAMTALVDIYVRRAGKSSSATVCYQRTALRPELNSHVIELAKQDSKTGQEWAQAIDACLKSSNAE